MGEINGTALSSDRRPLAKAKINAADRLQMPEYTTTTKNPSRRLRDWNGHGSTDEDNFDQGKVNLSRKMLRRWKP
jgi:hypothetical protein